MLKLKASSQFTALAILGFLGGCAAPLETTLPDGTVAYRISCDATTSGMNYCFENAGKTCGAEGYTILGPDGTPLSSRNAADTDLDAVVGAYQENRNSLLIRCGS